MAAATWPASLPPFPLYKGYGEVAQTQLIRTQQDTGPVKQRRRFTSNVVTFPTELILTETQVATLETFFYTTIEGGALRFNWTHPRTGAAVEFRFTEPYTIPQAISDTLYSVKMKLEILP